MKKHPIIQLILWFTWLVVLTWGKNLLPDSWVSLKADMAMADRFLFNHFDYPFLFSISIALFFSLFCLPSIIKLIKRYKAAPLTDQSLDRFYDLGERLIEKKTNEENHIITALKERQERGFADYLRPVILMGTDGEFERAKSFQIYSIRRFIAVAIQNSGSHFTSNCKFLIDVVVDGAQKTQYVESGFTLNPSKKRFIDIAYYDESAMPETNGHPCIYLTSKEATAFDSSIMLPINQPHILTMRIQCAEHAEVEKLARLSVENGKLTFSAA